MAGDRRSLGHAETHSAVRLGPRGGPSVATRGGSIGTLGGGITTPIENGKDYHIAILRYHISGKSKVYLTPPLTMSCVI